ncbi:MAG: universal stress protein [Elusimicrobiota bacterium]
MQRFPPKTIMFAADLAPSSSTALEAAKYLARRWRSRLEFVHVDAAAVHAGPSLMPEAGALWWPWADYHVWREQRVRKLVEDFPSARLTIRRVPGWPPATLADLAGPTTAGLVVMGTHGYAGLDRALFGSLAEAVIRRARVPVLAVHRRKSPFRIERILAPWNGRLYATAALLVAARWAESLGARLDVLHVTPPWAAAEGLAPWVRRRLDGLLGRGRAPRWSLRVISGDSRDVVLNEAAPGRCDLVVLSAHRRPLSNDFVMGSTVERVLRHSPVAVLAVPSTGAAAKTPARR